jgi:hypothetical protein
MRSRGIARCVTSSASVLASAMIVAAPATADPDTALNAAVTTVRGASQCPALVLDPLVQRAAEMATQGSSDYIAHRTAAVPFTDPMPALTTIGYTGSKAILLAGYGLNDADAIHALVLQGRNAIPDCSFTQYGESGLRDDGGFNLTSVVLAAP